MTDPFGDQRRDVFHFDDLLTRLSKIKSRIDDERAAKKRIDEQSESQPVPATNASACALYYNYCFPCSFCYVIFFADILLHSLRSWWQWGPRSICWYGRPGERHAREARARGQLERRRWFGRACAEKVAPVLILESHHITYTVLSTPLFWFLLS